MASSPIAPPPDTVRRTATNRSFTVPPRLSDARPSQASVEIGAAEGIETLYTAPNANIIKFTTSDTASRNRPSSSSAAEGATGTLPWASPTERTMAAGPLEIYRVPGSVSFLHSGALLHAILPRSQCWCVDGVSKFAFRVLPDIYYRIELPGKTEEDMLKVEELKTTLRKVLFFERTPCPFSRTFTVELPDETPKVRRTRKKSLGPAKKWKLARAYTWKPEDGEEPPMAENQEYSGGSLSGSEETDESAPGSNSEDELADEVRDFSLNTPTKIRDLKKLRSVTASPELNLRSTPPSRVQTKVFENGTVQVTTSTPREPPNQLDPTRLETFQAVPMGMPPSPPDSSAGAELGETSTRTETVAHQPELEKVDEKGGFEGDIFGVESEIEEAVKTPVDSSKSEQAPQMEQAEKVPEAISTPEPIQTPEAIHTPEPVRTPEPIQRPGPSALLDEIASIERSASQDRSRPNSSRGSSSSSRSASNQRQSGDDPFAAIQARILARRSIGGTTNFHPSRSPPRTATSTSVASSTSTTSTVSLSTFHQQDQAFHRALAQKAYTTIFSPPTNLVHIMLRIAARFANGTLRNTLLVQSPKGNAKLVPGSFDLRSVDAEDFDDEPAREEWEEDDFGVPVNSPIRVSGVRERERMARLERGWDVD